MGRLRERLAAARTRASQQRARWRRLCGSYDMLTGQELTWLARSATRHAQEFAQDEGGIIATLPAWSDGAHTCRVCARPVYGFTSTRPLRRRTSRVARTGLSGREAT
jgi:hypothetical protein